MKRALPFSSSSLTQPGFPLHIFTGRKNSRYSIAFPEREGNPSLSLSSPATAMVDTRPSSADDSGNGGGDVGKGQPSLSPTSSPTNSTKEKGGAEKGVPWARLLSQNSKSPHLSISASQFLVGRREDCDLYVKDSLVSQGSILCKLWRVEQEGLCMLEVTGGSCQVIVNTRRFYEGRYPLIGGEEVVFGSSGMHAYIFQHPLDVNQNNCNRPPSDYQTPNDVLKQGILSPDAIQDTLENFPYYLSENTKNPLLCVATVHLEKKFHPSLSAINSTNQRILLSGPSGSEIYQDKLIKALAKKFDASLLIVDSLLLAGAPSKVPKTLKDVNMSRPGDRVKYVDRYQRYLHPRQKRYQRGQVKVIRAECCLPSKIKYTQKLVSDLTRRLLTVMILVVYARKIMVSFAL